MKLHIPWILSIGLNMACCMNIQENVNGSKTHRTKRTAFSIELFSHVDRYFYAGIMIADQPFRVIADTGSDLLWVPFAAKGWGHHHEFVSQLARTTTYTNYTFVINHGAHKIVGFLAESDVTINGILLGDMRHGVANESFEIPTGSMNRQLPGVLGLAYGVGTEGLRETFVEHLFSRRLISYPVFSLSFQRNEDMDGILTLGPCELPNNAAPVYSVPKLQGPDWSIQLERIYVDGRIVMGSTQKVVIGTIYYDIYGPQAIVADINGRLGCFIEQNCTCIRRRVYPIISFHFPGVVFTLSAENYFIWPHEPNSIYCRSVFTPWPTDREGEWKFGVSFLQKYHTTFDQQRGTITFKELLLDGF